MLNLLFGRSLAATPSQLINASVDDLALCLRCLVLCPTPTSSLTGLLRRRIRIVNRSSRSRDLSDTADTRRVSNRTSATRSRFHDHARRSARQRKAVKAFCQIKCLHALSSFQRTGPA
jgi:hypothetical protein